MSDPSPTTVQVTGLGALFGRDVGVSRLVTRKVRGTPGLAMLNSAIGVARVLDLLSGEQLSMIC